MPRYIKRKPQSQSETTGRKAGSAEVRNQPAKRGPNQKATPVSKACSDEKSSSSSCPGEESSSSDTMLSESESLNNSIPETPSRKNTDHDKGRAKNFRDKQQKPPSAPARRRMPARAAVANKYIAMSLAESKSREQGVLDAQKEMARLNADQDRDHFFETLLSIKDLHVQNMGYILASWFWQSKIMTTSYAVLGVLSQLRSHGLQYELSEDPELVIGDIGEYRPLFVLFGAGVGSQNYVPYYDQMLDANQLDTYRYLVYRDHHHELLCAQNQVENWPDHVTAQRFSSMIVDSGRLHGILFRKEFNRARLMCDLLVRSLLRASRAYSEAVFSVALQYIGDHANIPTYWVWNSDYAVQTVMSVLEENLRLLHHRMEFSVRSGHWDEKYLDSFSGFTIGGRSFATETIISFFDEVVVPQAHSLQKKMKESIYSIQRHFREHFPDDDSNPDGGSKPPVPARNQPPQSSSLPSSKDDSIVITAPYQQSACTESIALEPVRCPSHDPDIYDYFGLEASPMPAEDFPRLHAELEPPKKEVHSNWTEAALRRAQYHASVLTKQEEKMEEVAEKVDQAILNVADHLEKVEPLDTGVSPLEVEHLIQLMCFQGAIVTAAEISRKGFCEAAVAFLEKMPYVPYHPLVTAYNRVADAYFFFPRFVSFVRYMELYQRVAPYGAEDSCLSLYVTTNQFPSARDPIHLPVSYFDHHIESPKCATGICFTQAELGFYNERNCQSVTPWRDHFAHVYANMQDDRIECDALNGEWASSLFTHGFISEVYYVNFFRPALCFTRACLPSALVTRLARAIPLVDPKCENSLLRFRRKATWPKIQFENEFPLIDLEIFESYLVNMPAASRKKHVEHFKQRFSVVGVLTMPKADDAFPKYDEVLPTCKPRLIINPPSELFYELVFVATMIKRALKRKSMFLLYETETHSIYFSYGADMTVRQKSNWFGKAMEKCRQSLGRVVACFIVGGDDNACIIGINGRVFAWESDVTACDQSHNVHLVHNFVETCRVMGAPESSLQVLKDSYMRPLRIQNVKIKFKKPQLHTGHPQTSLANTITVGEVCTSIVADMKYESLRTLIMEPDFFEQFSETVRLRAAKFGMIFKVQVHERPLDVTFHKGHWVPANHEHLKHGFVWMPLPSCLWKATKIRTDSHISRKELLVRMAFNLYQRLIYPNHQIVRSYCLKLFRTIMALLDMNAIEDQQKFGAFVEANFNKYYERASLNKSGEIDKLDPFMDLDQEPFWDQEAANEFIRRRYLLTVDDLFPGDGTFRGVRCAGWDAVISRDYGADTLEESLIQLFGYSGHAMSSRSS